MTGGVAGLVLLQPDLGSAVAIVGVVPLHDLRRGGAARAPGLIGGLAVPVVALAVYMAPYRLRRVLTFLDPWADPRGAGFQIIQSYLALGGGGFLAAASGSRSRSSSTFRSPTPTSSSRSSARSSDSVGALATVVLFGILLWRGIRIGLRVADPFGALVAFGVTALLVNQAVVNLGVVVGRVPDRRACRSRSCPRAGRRCWWRWPPSACS